MENEKLVYDNDELTRKIEESQRLETELEEKTDSINKALLNFVLRVAEDVNAKPEELQALPAVATIVIEILKPKIIKIDYGWHQESCVKQQKSTQT